MLSGMKFIDKTHTDRLHSLIMESSTITVIGHTHPDGDSIGSALGFSSYLRNIGKNAVAVFPNPIGDSLKFMLEYNEDNKVLIFSDEPEKVKRCIDSSDLIICLDFNSFSRTDEMADILSAAKCRKVLIDHHLNPSYSDFGLAFSKTDISSTCELLYYILKEMPEIDGEAGKLPKDCAMALMTGMTTDTNNFANSVFPGTLAMASELLEAGVDRDRIIASLYNEYRENRLRAMGYILDKIMKITADGVAYIIMTKDILDRFDIQEGETEGFVNLPLAISRVNISIFLKEDGNHFRVSVRSKKGYSANRMAATFFNGGGHECAAGGKLFIPKDIAGPQEAEQYILNAIAEFQK